MKPELKLAQMLSSDEVETKLASMSVEELSGLLKEANGDMLQYFQDHPEKLKEKQERDAKKEKKAGIEEVGDADLLQMADEMGRELAHKEKTSALAFGVGKVLGGIGSAAKAVGNAAKAIPGAIKKAPQAASGVGNFLKKDLQATKQQFAAGLKGEARPALAKTPVPLVHHNAMQNVPAPAAAKPGMSTGMKMGLVAGGAAAAGVGAGMAGHNAMDKHQARQGMVRTASVEKTALFGLSQEEKYMKAHNAYADEFNKPENVAKANEIHQEVLKRKYNTTQKDAPGHIWELAFNEVDAHPHFSGMRDRHFKKFGKSPGREVVTKEASIQKIAVSFNQVNEGTKMMGRVTRLYDRFKGPVGEAAKAVGKKAHGAVKTLGSNISKIEDPILKGTAIGAATGGVGGAVSGLIDPKEDPYTGQKQRLRSAFRRGVSGAAGGAATGALFGSMGKTSSVRVQKLEAALEKSAAGVGMAGLGSMAKNFVGSMKPVAEKAMGAIKPMAQNAMAKAAPMATKALGGKSMGQVAGTGAAIGAGLGAAKGLVAPGKDAQGQQKSRLGAMAGGALKGGVVGAGIGAGAKAALPHMQNAAQGLAQAPKQMSLGL